MNDGDTKGTGLSSANDDDSPWPASGPSDAEVDIILQLAREGARRAGAKPHEADEVAQIVAIKLAQRWNDHGLATARQRGLAGLRAYIWVAARNTHTDLLRSRTRREQRQRRSAGASIGPRPTDHRPGATDPEFSDRRPDETSAVEMRVDIANALSKLPPKHRDALILVTVFGYTYAETADMLGVSISAITSLVHRARRTLAEQLKEDQS